MTEAGRAYAVPFGEVWQAALAVVRRGGSLRLLRDDPHAGEIEAEGRSLLLRRRRPVLLRLRLDEFGLTRLEARVGPGDPGREERILRAVDRALLARGASRG
jgi:hypothetical protein